MNYQNAFVWTGWWIIVFLFWIVLRNSSGFLPFLQALVLFQITFWQIFRALVFDLLINSQWLTRSDNTVSTHRLDHYWRRYLFWELQNNSEAVDGIGKLRFQLIYRKSGKVGARAIVSVLFRDRWTPMWCPIASQTLSRFLSSFQNRL